MSGESAMPLRIGTRASALARAQAELVAAGLARASGRQVELVDVTTHGDTNRAPLSQIGGTGVFVSALRDELLDGKVDVAVHSLKDLPTAAPEGLTLAAVPERADSRDMLVASGAGTLAGLPSGARVGTGSPRRAAQLRAARPDLDVVDIRGNVDTRLGRVFGGPGVDPADLLDGVVLAKAGLDRLGRGDVGTEVLAPEVVLPAPGQGALAVECRADDVGTARLLAALDHEESRSAVTAERALLAELEAGCAAPVGALATVRGAGQLELQAAAFALDGTVSIRRTATGSSDGAAQLGRDLAAEMLAEGVAALMGEHV
ncbi:MAG: hydroxymethylbilane synthase [Streptosporangiales bacterium]|nr:hydroxymethylbilane synthase [Streptosporangiales bacterium]